ncbi:hypothetical protein AB0D45_10525 [Streptomyces sp. NPDC048352]|uniref:hypothetical protein n=1 Tax=Streptomyces sp. NPDC048352 TaxID=3154718 RepID=UPI00341A2006
MIRTAPAAPCRSGSSGKAPTEEVAVEDEAELVVMKLGVWVSNTKSRRDKLTLDQLDAPRGLGVDWA